MNLISPTPSDLPLFSIITATYNAAKVLPALAASISGQLSNDYEWIVVDGCSHDGTVALLENITDPRMRWISEPDCGIYDAMNKGLNLARGRYIYFIGADDRLASPEVLVQVAAAITHADADLVCGIVDTGSRTRFMSSLGFKTRVLNSVHHQAAFYRRSVFEDFRYRTDVPVIADYELNLLGCIRNWRFMSVDLLIAICGTEGISNTSNVVMLYEQMHRLRSRHLGVMRSRLYWAIGLINVLRRRIKPRDR